MYEGYLQTIIEHFAIYWSLCLFLTFSDVLLYDKWFPLKKNNPRLKDSLTNIFKNVILNQLYSIPLFYLFNFENKSISFSELLKLFPTIILIEFLFYHIHVLFHNSYFFKKIHFKHHLWIDPIALSTFYCHPLEHLLLNIFPFLASCRYMGLNLSTLRFLQTLAIINTTFSAHSGYAITSNFHYFHHIYLNCNYGLIGLFDKIYSTKKENNF